MLDGNKMPKFAVCSQRARGESVTVVSHANLFRITAAGRFTTAPKAQNSTYY
jgi:hypothetical protein